MILETFGLGMGEFDPLDDFEEAQDMCNKWEDSEFPQYWDDNSSIQQSSGHKHAKALPDKDLRKMPRPLP